MTAPAALPDAKWERWKYSPLAKFVAMPDAPAPAAGPALPAWAADMAAMPWPGAGQYNDMGIWDIGGRVVPDTVVIDIPAGAAGEHDIAPVWAGAAFMAARVLVRVGAGASVTLNDIWAASGGNTGWLHRTVRLDLAAGASCRWRRLQPGGDNMAVTDMAAITLAAGASCDMLTLNAGGRFHRNQTHAVLAGSGAALTLRGACLLAGERHGDTTITIEHTAPGCTSNQAFRNIIAGQGQGVFQGKVHVHRAGQQTDGYQLCNTILLSPQAVMNTKPELEIYADDVKCSHGTTTGQMDDTPLFYMRSRGIPLPEARRILLTSFALSVLEDGENGGSPFAAFLEEWLAAV